MALGTYGCFAVGVVFCDVERIVVMSQTWRYCISFIERRLWSLECFVFSCAYSCNLHKCKREKYVESFVAAIATQL